MATSPNAKVVRINDFRGGLNLRADQMRLNPDESPDLVDVDVDPKGGFRTRPPVDNLNSTALGAAALNPIAYSNSSGTEQLIVRKSGGTLYYSTGGDFTQITGYTPAGATRGATFDNLLYVQDGSSACQQWNGSSRTAMGTSWSPDKTAPTSGNVPIAKLICAWQGRMWVAYTTESSTAYKNRLRWSHPDKADAWKQEDAIEIDDGRDGDEITALLPFGDLLMIFKRHSVHILSGFPDDTGDTSGSLLVTPLTYDSGAPDQDSVCSSPTRAFWWSWPDGVYAYDASASKAYYLFQRIRPAIQDGRIIQSQTPCLQWYDGRLYVSCGWDAYRTLFVFDPSVSKDGAWVRYSLRARHLIHWRQAASSQLVMIVDSGQYLLHFMPFGTSAHDDFGDSTSYIQAYLRTAWFDVNVTSAKKRWKSPRVVGEAANAITVSLRVYHNYDDVNRKRNVDMALGRTDVGADWATGTWGAFMWTNADTWPSFVRTANLGTSNAVQIQFQGPATQYWWQIAGIELPYVQKRVR